MTYTASTRTISGITLNEITSEYVGSPLLFIIGAVTYFGFISSVTSDLSSTTVVLAVSASLPSSSGTVTSITVIAYNDASDIITLTDLKQYLGVTVTDTDAMFASWITLISELIEDKLSQPVQPRAIEEILDGDNTGKIYLNQARIVSLVGTDEATRLSNLQYRTLATDAWTNLLTDETFIYTVAQGWFIELLDDNLFPVGRKNIRINYNGGFDPIPGEIVKMVYEMIQIMWDESKSGMQPRLGMSSKNRGGAGSNLGDSFLDMNPRWQKTIERYRKML